MELENLTDEELVKIVQKMVRLKKFILFYTTDTEIL